jgi:hypothetical protein
MRDGIERFYIAERRPRCLRKRVGINHGVLVMEL